MIDAKARLVNPDRKNNQTNTYRVAECKTGGKSLREKIRSYKIS